MELGTSGLGTGPKASIAAISFDLFGTFDLWIPIGLSGLSGLSGLGSQQKPQPQKGTLEKA